MPALRRALTDPRTWLMLLALLLAAGIADSFRPAPRQITAAGYCLLVRGYQRVGRPLLKGHVRCRFVPSCSEYSLEAVQTFGIRRGLVLTVDRLRRCQNDVHIGTPDPVPSS